MEKIKLLIAYDQPEEKNEIVEALLNVDYITVAGEAQSAEESLELLEQVYADVALVSASLPGDGYLLAEKIAVSHPEVTVIIIERELKEETMRKALFSGARDVLLFPFTPSKLVDSIYHGYRSEQKKQLSQRGRGPRSRKRSRQGQILTVFGTKGGVGRTFISANLAVALAGHTGEKVALVDLNLDSGNTSLALNIIPRYTISDVINDIRNLDQDLIESYLIPHSSGVKLLAGDSQPQMAEFVTAEHVDLILKVLQGAFDYVVVDMPPRFHAPVDPAFRSADLLFLVTTPEVAALQNTKACLSTFNQLKYPRSKIKVLLNRADSWSEIKPRDVEKTLNCSLEAVFPADYRQAASSMNQGIPLVLLYPRARASRSFQELVRRISGPAEERPATQEPAGESSESPLREVN